MGYDNRILQEQIISVITNEVEEFKPGSGTSSNDIYQDPVNATHVAMAPYDNVKDHSSNEKSGFFNEFDKNAYAD